MTDQSRAAAAPPGWADPRPPAGSGPGWRRALPLLLWLGCLTLAVALLLALGQGRLAAPALTDPGAWRAWAAGRDPLEVTMVVLRLLALACAWYLTGVTSISVVARTLRAVRLVRLADALSVGPIRHLVQQAVGISLAAGVLATSVPAPVTTGRAAAGARDREVAVMTAMAEDEVPPDASSTPGAPEAPGGAVAPSVAVMVPVPVLQAGTPSASPSPTAPASRTAPAPDVAPALEVSPEADGEVATSDAGSSARSEDRGVREGREGREVRVRSGDHFWAMAEEAVAEHLGRPGTEEEVAAHWEAVVASNADRLVVAGNPDLLRPGQLVLLPPVEEVQP